MGLQLLAASNVLAGGRDVGRGGDRFVVMPTDSLVDGPLWGYDSWALQLS